MPATTPLARTVILTDAGTYPYSDDLAAYTAPPGGGGGTPTPTPSPTGGQYDFSNPANSGLI